MKKANILMVAILVVCLAATAIGLIGILKAGNQGQDSRSSSDFSLFGSLSKSKPGIGVVKVYGPIYTENEGSVLGLPQGGSDEIVTQLDRLRRDTMIKAVVLRINSPGGTLGASQEIAAAVLRVRQDGKKVIVSMGDVAASGGYYIAAQAHKIVANRGTITGSIGVISAALNFSKLMEKYGVTMNVVKQGKNKDIFAYWRDMTPEEREIIEELSHRAYEQFLDVVSKGRNIPKNELLAFADGRIFTGEQALEYKLVDELGGLATAIRIAATEVGLNPDDPSIIYEEDTGIKKLFQLMGTRQSAISPLHFFEKMSTSSIPVLFYSGMPLPQNFFLGDMEN